MTATAPYLSAVEYSGQTGGLSAKALAATRRSNINGLAIGVLTALMTATQLRTPGGIGVFEAALVGFMVVSIPFGRWSLRSASRFPGILVLGYIVFSLIGAVIASRLTDATAEASIMTLLPHVLILIVLEYTYAQTDRRVFFETWAFTFGLIYLGAMSMLLAYDFLVSPVFGPFELRFGRTRFQGWTSNPNQAAAILSVAVAALGRSSRSRAIHVFALLAGFAVGFETGSDGLRVGMMAATGAVLFTLGLSRARGLAGALRRLGALSIVALGVLFAIYFLPALISEASSVAADGGQASERTEIWAACWEATTMSPLVGLGPGARVNAAGESHECHSIFFDTSMSAGLPMLAALLISFAVIGWRQVMARDLWGTGFIAAFLAISIFNYFLRYPQVWLMLSYLVVVPRPKSLTTIEKKPTGLSHYDVQEMLLYTRQLPAERKDHVDV